MQVTERDGVVIVSLVEDRVATLWKTLEPQMDAGKRHYVLDMSLVPFLNSVNIAAIIGARNKIILAGGSLTIAELKDRVRSIFRVLKLDRYFDLELNLDAAIKASR
jgi:anti-anti-sigma factor